MLIVIIGILAASASFFYAKTTQSPKSEKTPSSLGSSSIEATSLPTPEKSSQVIEPASSSKKPSTPSDVYTIEKNETLFEVAEKHDLTWTELAEINGLEDADKIMVGQVLVIAENGEVKFTINQEKADNLQGGADSGKFDFRLSPEETARSDSPPIYGLSVEDSFVLEEKDDLRGTAIVKAKKGDQKYLIKLSQPSIKGEKGIWAIISIQQTV